MIFTRSAQLPTVTCCQGCLLTIKLLYCVVFPLLVVHVLIMVTYYI